MAGVGEIGAVGGGAEEGKDGGEVELVAGTPEACRFANGGEEIADVGEPVEVWDRGDATVGVGCIGNKSADFEDMCDGDA